MMKFICGVFLLLLPAPWACADTLYLKNGRTIDGIIKSDNAERVELEVGLNSSLTFPRSGIDRIVESSKQENIDLRQKWEQRQTAVNQKIKELKVAEEKQPKSADYSHDSQGIKVKATLNGRVDADLVLDTGASLVMITRRIAQEMRLNLRNAPDLRVQLADGRQVSAKHVIIDTMKVQGIMVDDVEAVVLTDEVKGLNFGDGLLGMSFLKRFNFKVDQKEKKLILEKL